MTQIYAVMMTVMMTLMFYRHLARNPFICDCNLRWLSEYLQSHPIETSGARCESPRRMQRKKIGLVKNDKFRCKGMNTLISSRVPRDYLNSSHASRLRSDHK